MKLANASIPQRIEWAVIITGLLCLAFILACGTRAGSGRFISVDGSSTVFPITEAVAEQFGAETGGTVRVTVGVSGTGGGFKKFCHGETDVTDASRPIKASEIDLCEKEGVEFVEIPVAIDGLTVMVHPDNDFVECITVQELHTIWSPEAEEEITRWNQVDPDWPDESLRLYGPGVASGTFDYFTEVVNGEAQASRGDFTASEDDNVLVHGISGDKRSLGYFGFAFFIENKDNLKAVKIDGGSGCIEPTKKNINDGTYAPLSRPLFIYVTQAGATKAFVKEFIRYYLSEDGRELVEDVGYIAYPAEVYDLALARFENGRTGTLFGGANPRQGSVAEVLASGQ